MDMPTPAAMIAAGKPLEGRVAIVTGSTSGIGLGIALALARAGCRVVIADRDLPTAEAAARELQEAGYEVIALPMDVTDSKSVGECVQTAIARLGRIDILVNNAGIHSEKIGEPSTVEQFEK